MLEISFLMHLTASACGRKAYPMHGMNSRERLELYRTFTVDAVNSCSAEELHTFRRNMYLRAYRTGRCLAAVPGFKSRERRKRLIVLLYRNIGIEVRDLEKTEKEEENKAGFWRMQIPRCSFSQAYTPKTCYAMSGLDAGIICGILGGGKLEFVQRITEGCTYCSAFYSSPHSAS